MARPHAQLHARSLTIERGDRTLVRDASLTLGPGDRVGLVGDNGAGKSTLMAVLAGEFAPTGGTVAATPAGATVGVMRQEIDAQADETIIEHLARVTGVAAASAALDDATDALGATAASDLVGEVYQQALDLWLDLGGADLDARAAAALDEVGLRAEHLDVDVPVAGLSGGQRARLGLAAIELARHDVLFLDEPTNDLDTDGLHHLEALVHARQSAVMIVSHDRRFLERTVNAVVEIDSARGIVTRYNESYLGYLDAKAIARAHEEARYDSYVRTKRTLESRAETQRQWATSGVKREKRFPVDNDKAARDFRINRTEKLASKARQTDRALDRLDEVDKPWEPWQLQFRIGQAARAGDLVAEVEGAVVERGAFRLGPIDLAVTSGDRVAVTGVNGSGKTTLLAALFGWLPLDAGRQRLGPSVVIGRLDQARTQLDAHRDAVHYLVDDAATTPEEARSVLAKFGLGASHVTRPTTSLSPGERTRAVMARFQVTGVNTLVLDEPTNHLDLAAIEQLEQALDNYDGTLLLVTHDRALLDATTITRRIEVDQGRITVDEIR
ncbi:MAG: ABC-F family ATP-binding cassette domain-containing protein [Actinomycetota bacterium]